MAKRKIRPVRLGLLQMTSEETAELFRRNGFDRWIESKCVVVCTVAGECTIVQRICSSLKSREGCAVRAILDASRAFTSFVLERTRIQGR